MKYGYYSDNEIPESIANSENYKKLYKLNSKGYRCQEFSPLPNGGKNVVVLGCSHTFGEGLNENEVWVSQLEKIKNNNIYQSSTKLRFWNLAHPGASPDLCVRILYGTEKVLFPKIIIVCWPVWSRRERLDKYPQSLTSDDILLKNENEQTDCNNFLKCVFQIEKFAEHTHAKVFHCFSQDIYDIPNTTNVFKETSIKSCWPEWDRRKHFQNLIKITTEPNLARDGIHYGTKHHASFAKKFYNKFGTKLK